MQNSPSGRPKIQCLLKVAGKSSLRAILTTRPAGKALASGRFEKSALDLTPWIGDKDSRSGKPPGHGIVAAYFPTDLCRGVDARPGWIST